jgi:hypothetical protein
MADFGSGALGRNFSVDDLVGGIWRLNQAGMGRSDSEAAFQEFLKRIPSATNLASATNLDPAQLEAQLQHHAQQMQQVQHAAPASSGPSSSGAPDSPSHSGGGDSGGIPRVPSLELLRQMVMSQQMGPPAVKAESSAPRGERSPP